MGYGTLLQLSTMAKVLCLVPSISNHKKQTYTKLRQTDTNTHKLTQKHIFLNYSFYAFPTVYVKHCFWFCRTFRLHSDLRGVSSGDVSQIWINSSTNSPWSFLHSSAHSIFCSQKNQRIYRFFIYLLFIHLLYLHVGLCTTCVPDARGGQKRTSDPKDCKNT